MDFDFLSYLKLMALLWDYSDTFFNVKKFPIMN